MFFKISALKNFAILIGKHLCWPLKALFYRTFIVTASRLSRQQILFFQVNLVFIAYRHTGFFSVLFRKHDLNLRSSHWDFSVKKEFLEVLQISQENTFAEFFFNRVAGGLQIYQKETPTQMFSWRIYKIFKNTKFEDCERLLLKPVLSPELPFLVTYTSDTN